MVSACRQLESAMTRTEMEVVVLSISERREEGNGVDDG